MTRDARPCGLLQVAEDLAEGRITSVQLVQAAAAAHVAGAIERVVPDAMAQAEQADARRVAGRARGAWDGMPIGVKANIAVRGLPTTAGTGVQASAAGRDARALAMLRRAGMVPVLTTTLAEAALGAVTDNPHTGPCPSPRDPSVNAGGSSGGSAAVVAAGVVPFALGSDTMGSVRIPGAYCGVAAYKPTRGRVSTAGLVPLHRLLDTVGFLAPTAADLAAVLPTIVPDAGEPRTSAPLTIGVPRLVAAADSTARRTVENAVAGLEALGHRVVRDVEVPFEPDVLRRRGLLLCEVGGYRHHRVAVDSADPGISDHLRSLFLYGAGADPARVAAAHAELIGLSRRIRSVVARVDALVLPTAPQGPPKLGEDPPHAADLTAWVNVAGLPAVSVPVGGNHELRGLQVVGSAGDDALVASIAVLIEQGAAASA